MELWSDWLMAKEMDLETVNLLVKRMAVLMGWMWETVSMDEHSGYSSVIMMVSHLDMVTDPQLGSQRETWWALLSVTMSGDW